jgi:hypothetical protein
MPPAGRMLVTSPPPPQVRLSAKVRQLYRRGRSGEALDVHYEDLVRRKTAGTSGMLHGREIDVILPAVLIQTKRSYTALEKPGNFLNANTRRQIKTTIFLASHSGGSSTLKRGEIRL